MHPSLSTERSHQLQQILSLQKQQVSEYIEYLNEIKSCVTLNDTARLTDLVDEPVLTPELIQSSQQQQANLLTEHGYDSSPRGLEQFIQDSDRADELASLKKSLDDKLRELEKSLFINAYLVRKNQQRVKQSISILTGHQQTNPSTTYSREGNTQNIDLSRRSLAEA
jgi:flagellar biosynthesis/type III secretory pathway chaperone